MIFAKIGCSAHRLPDWIKRADVPSDLAEKLKTLERENRELRQVKEVLHKGCAYLVGSS